MTGGSGEKGAKQGERELHNFCSGRGPVRQRLWRSTDFDIRDMTSNTHTRGGNLHLALPFHVKQTNLK